jgi:hypothetical protein
MVPMQINFPDDADGDALRRLAERGSDLSKPKLIDFQIAVHTESAAKANGDAAQRELGELSVGFDGYADGWGTFGNASEVQPP